MATSGGTPISSSPIAWRRTSAARRPMTGRACPDGRPGWGGVGSDTLRTIKRRSTAAAGLRSLSPAVGVVGTRPDGALACRRGCRINARECARLLYRRRRGADSSRDRAPAPVSRQFSVALSIVVPSRPETAPTLGTCATASRGRSSGCGRGVIDRPLWTRLIPRRTTSSSALGTEMPYSSSKASRQATNAPIAASMFLGVVATPIGRRRCASSWGKCSATRSSRPTEAFVASHQIQSQKCVVIATRASLLGSTGGTGSCECSRNRYSTFVGPRRRTWYHR
jgi:hypothetical protein